MADDDEVMLNVLRCQLTLGTSCDQCRSMVQYCFTSTEPEGSLGRTAQDGHLDSHTAPELCKMALIAARLNAGVTDSQWW